MAANLVQVDMQIDHDPLRNSEEEGYLKNRLSPYETDKSAR